MILYGRPIQEEIIKKVNNHPTLKVFLVGENKASLSYVRSKKKLFEEANGVCLVEQFPETVDRDTLLNSIEKSNKDPSINGIIVQLPLPKHLEDVPLYVYSKKDVDGFTPFTNFTPCTPLGICLLLDHYKIPTEGKTVVILGRSKEVGRPLANILSNTTYNSTVILCHSKTPNIKQFTTQADILISAIGKHIIDASYIKPEAVCIDIGINHVDGHLVGDFILDDEFKNKCSSYTPTPKGTGLTTTAALLYNTTKAALLYNTFMEELI